MDQIKIIQMNLDLKAITICYQVNYPAVLYIKSSKTKKFPRDNLTKSEREALLNLQKRNDIIITKADKGSAVVILDINNYIDETNIQFNDTNNYEQLDFNP